MDCVSATALQSVYSDTPGRWNPDYEREYRRIQTWLSTNQTQQLGSSKERVLDGFDYLRAARLMAFLR